MKKTKALFMIAVPVLAAAMMISSCKGSGTRSKEKAIENLDVSDESFLKAVQEDDLDLVKKLIAAGVNVEAVTPLDSNQYGVFGNFPASHLAAAVGNLDMLKAIKEAGADLNSRDYNDGGIYMQAIQAGSSPEVIAYLIENGADVNAQDKEGFTPLMMAAVTGNTDAIKRLIAAGADVERAENQGWTALTFAATVGKVEAVRELIAAGANVNAKGSTGGTAIVFSADFGYNDISKMLLDAGADPNVKETDGKTPLQMAIEHQNEELEQMLRKAGAK